MRGPSMEQSGVPPPLAAHAFVAEFDIDKGSTLRATFPSCPDGVSEHWIADRMLPEGAHALATDWTAFLLPPRAAAPPLPPRGALYCVSVLRTKFDARLRRGARVRAVGIASPYPFAIGSL